MCGIAGILSFSAGAPVKNEILAAMRDSMIHRGPDGDGLWISPEGRIGLAHRRLAIVDLSDSAAQPMSDAEQTVWVTFNGEIYNHLGLRATLEKAGHHSWRHRQPCADAGFCVIIPDQPAMMA